MPLLLMCGQPGSGKSYRAQQIKDFITKNYNLDVVIFNEEMFKIEKKEAYKNSLKEKEIRAFWKSNIEKNIDNKKLIILDNMNYIKGYRYELYCMARTNKTTYCVVYVDSDIKTCKQNSSKLENSFTEDQIEEYYKVMERPMEKNRWDYPLFTVFPEEELPLKDIHKTLFLDKVLSKTPVSTKLEFNAGNNFVKETDNIIQSILKKIIDEQNKNIMMNNSPKCKIIFENKDCLEIIREIKLGELKNWKKEFININNLNPLMNKDALNKGFIYFIKSKLK